MKMNKKICTFIVTKEAQEEINEIRRRCGFKEEPIVPEYEMEYMIK